MGRLVVGVGGSRSASEARGRLVCRVARAAALAGAEVRVGCASGVDSLAGSEVLRVEPSRLVLFCASGPGSRVLGSERGRAVESVGGSVVWWAGGREGSRSSRLRGRSVALARSGLSCFLAFPGPRSRGTWVAVRAAVAAGVPVFVWPPGRSPLPSLGRGRWVRLPLAGFWSGAWAWRPLLSPSPSPPFPDLNEIERDLIDEQPRGSTALVPYKGGAVDQVIDKVTGEIFRPLPAKHAGDPRRRHRTQRAAGWALLNVCLVLIAIYIWTSLYWGYKHPPQVIPPEERKHCEEVFERGEGWTIVCTQGGE